MDEDAAPYRCPCNGDGYCAYCAENGPAPDYPGGGYFEEGDT